MVRTILSVNEADQSLTFAGDVPAGGYVRLMKANFDRLIDGAVGAGRVSAEALGAPVDLALLISCVGRRMVLRQRVEEEVEGVRDIVGPTPPSPASIPTAKSRRSRRRRAVSCTTRP